MTLASDGAEPEAPAPLRSRPLFSMKLAVDPVLEIGGPEGSGRRVANISGGSFDGSQMRGTVLPGGTDWLTLRADGVVLLDARLVLRTDDRALIAMTFVGMRHGPPEVMARLSRGEPVDPATYYFRTVPAFTTSDPRYAWLDRIIAVGDGDRRPDGPHYRIHEIL